MERAPSRLAIIAAHITVLLVLGYAYYHFVAVLYAYQGFGREFSALRLSISVIVLIAMVGLVSSRKPVSFYLNHLAIITIVTPSLVLFYAGSETLEFMLVTCASFFTMALMSRIHIVHVPQLLPFSPPFMLICMTILAGLITVFLAVASGLPAPNFDLAAVYELREEVNQGTGIFFSYIQSLGSKAVLPMAVALACAYRQRGVVLALCALAVLMFGYTTHKSMALYPVVVVAMYYAAGGKHRMTMVVWGVAALAVLAIIDTMLYLNYNPSMDLWLVSYLVRRALFVPAQLNADFLDVFSTAEFFYWSNSRITLGLVPTPSIYDPPSLVAVLTEGRVYSANTGWIGSGYAQAGVFGALVYSVLLGLIFAVLDRLARRINPRVVLAAAVVPIFAALTSADLLTAIGTHGIALTIFFLLMMRDPGRLASERHAVPMPAQLSPSGVLQ